ncbi:MAG: hypothetical protein ACRDU4_16545 [Mycobacterium sp.]
MQLYFYYILLSDEDASNIMGLEFTDPVLVAALAYIFLGERVPAGGYLAMAEFSIKVAADHLPGTTGFAIESMVAGTVVCGLLFKRRVRLGVLRELPNLRYALAIEALTLSSILCTVSSSRPTSARLSMCPPSPRFNLWWSWSASVSCRGRRGSLKIR